MMIAMLSRQGSGTCGSIIRSTMSLRETGLKREKEKISIKCPPQSRLRGGQTGQWPKRQSEKQNSWLDTCHNVFISYIRRPDYGGAALDGDRISRGDRLHSLFFFLFICIYFFYL